MNFTFGIITDGNQVDRVNRVVDSISNEATSNDEIFTVCDKNLKYRAALSIPYDPQKKSWITRKKNLIAQHATNDTLVLLHDYLKLEPGWRASWEQYGVDWDIGMNVILNLNGERFRDWCAWDDPRHGNEGLCFEPWCSQGIVFKGKACVVPYSYNQTQYMYISGTYFLVKRQVLLDNPFNENLCWGAAEDVEWSMRVRNKYKYVMNSNAVVTLMKEKDRILPYVLI